MSAPDEILYLVRRFREHYDSYRSPSYNETQLRREFVDPFFKALGWDVDNKRGYAEPYKDVIHEDSIKIGGSTKAPDYSFRIGGTRKFFVETKKPAVNIAQDVSPAFQLRRYAWSAKLPLSILTDFEEFAVYDCRVRPEKNDKASKARTLYLNYEQYEDHCDDIALIFSRDAILKGSFDKYAESTKKKRGTAEVDDAFLDEIEHWRSDLARNLAVRNRELSQREINFAVQKTIDRIIFLRICEDRGIEAYGGLQSLPNGPNIYPRLCELFRLADDRYNSGLFHFTQEKDRTEPTDGWTLSLKVDDRVLKEIIGKLYYPESPYEFSVLGADILGQVYEQFLGKVIRLTKGHHAKIEDKPEVKKAGGVYYTPTYIVDYIVEQTVGKLLDGKKPNEVAARTRTTWKRSKRGTPLTVLDPACGSGSFLIGAYQCLLDWYRDWYVEHDTAKHKDRVYQTRRDQWRLTTAERKRILLDHIYGVDVDPQAVEVTKLSLLLKVLEGENQESLQRQLRLFHERALPDLGHNIKCGNSLIGPDFYERNQLDLLDEEERLRINVFDWQAEFAEIMQSGGFDAVIGNPPYVDIKGMPEVDVRYIFERYQTANNRINLFATFVERCIGLVAEPSFRYSMIVPTALLAQSSYRELRQFVLERCGLSSLVRLPNESFGRAAGEVKVDTVIFVLSSSQDGNASTEIIGYSGYKRISTIDPQTANVHKTVNAERWKQDADQIWSVNTSDADEAILKKCRTKSVPLEECVDFCLGLTPYDKYRGHSREQIENRAFHADHKKDDSFKPLLAGNDVRRYITEWNGKKWISYGSWLGAPREQRFFVQRRILVKQIIDWSTKRIWASIEDRELYNTQNAFNLLAKPDWSLEYVLGILNSRLMTYYHRKKYLDEFKMRFQKILIRDCRRFPIRPVSSSAKDKSRHDRVVQLVGRMSTLRKQAEAIKTTHERTALWRQIEATDRGIDRLVCELYGLSDKEIQVVEEATAG